MSQYVETPTKTFPANAAAAQYLRVTLNSSGKVAVAGIADYGIGTLERAAFDADEPVAVRLWSAAGTRKMIAAGALTAGDPVFTVAGGKVGDTAATAYRVGVALHDVAADGDIVEVLVCQQGAAVAP